MKLSARVLIGLVSLALTTSYGPLMTAVTATASASLDKQLLTCAESRTSSALTAKITSQSSNASHARALITTLSVILDIIDQKELALRARRCQLKLLTKNKQRTFRNSKMSNVRNMVITKLPKATERFPATSATAESI